MSWKQIIFSSECYYKNKDWKNALQGYDYVNSKGFNKYFEKATLEAARINYFELKDYANAKKYFESLTQQLLLTRITNWKHCGDWCAAITS